MPAFLRSNEVFALVGCSYWLSYCSWQCLVGLSNLQSLSSALESSVAPQFVHRSGWNQISGSSAENIGSLGQRSCLIYRPHLQPLCCPGLVSRCELHFGCCYRTVYACDSCRTLTSRVSTAMDNALQTPRRCSFWFLAIALRYLWCPELLMLSFIWPFLDG